MGLHLQLLPKNFQLILPNSLPWELQTSPTSPYNHISQFLTINVYPTDSISVVKPWFWDTEHIAIKMIFGYWLKYLPFLYSLGGGILVHPNRTQTFGKGCTSWTLSGDIVWGRQDTLALLHLEVWILSSLLYQGISGISILFTKDHSWESINLFTSTTNN